MRYVGPASLRGMARRAPRVPSKLSAALTPGQRRRRRRLDQRAARFGSASDPGLPKALSREADGLHTHSLKLFTCENVSQSHDLGTYRA